MALRSLLWKPFQVENQTIKSSESSRGNASFFWPFQERHHDSNESTYFFLKVPDCMARFKKCAVEIKKDQSVKSVKGP
jgi:hypothetical protein